MNHQLEGEILEYVIFTILPYMGMKEYKNVIVCNLDYCYSFAIVNGLIQNVEL